MKKQYRRGCETEAQLTKVFVLLAVISYYPSLLSSVVLTSAILKCKIGDGGRDSLSSQVGWELWNEQSVKLFYSPREQASSGRCCTWPFLDMLEHLSGWWSLSDFFPCFWTGLEGPLAFGIRQRRLRPKLQLKLRLSTVSISPSPLTDRFLDQCDFNATQIYESLLSSPCYFYRSRGWSLKKMKKN